MLKYSKYYFKSTKSLEENGEKVLFFACWYRFIEIKSWLKNIGMGVVINGYAHSGWLVFGVLI